MKDRRLTQKQIERLLANNPNKIELNIEPPQQETPNKISFSGTEKDYDTLKAIEQVKTFCAFIKELISHYEENQRRQEQAETEEMDLKHCMELVKLNEKEKKVLFQKLTDVLQTRRACKSENEILQPLYSYFSDKVLLNKLTQIQGTAANIKNIVENRTYSCRTNILDETGISTTM